MKHRIHTAQIQTTTDFTGLINPAIKNQRGTTKLACNEFRGKFNPDGVNGVNVYTKSGFYTALGMTIAECELDNCRINRLDFCYQFEKLEFDTVYRKIKLLLYVLAVKFDYTDNIQDTYDDFNVRKKSVKVQDTKDSSWNYQFEFYNKRLQKSNSRVKSHLEFRFGNLIDKDIPELEKVDAAAQTLISMLTAVTSDRDNTFTRTAQELNANLIYAYKVLHKNVNLRDFVVAHQDSFLVKGQLTAFIRKVRPDIHNPAKRAQQLTESIGLKTYEKSDLAKVVEELIYHLRLYLQG